jgi:N-acetyl-anhydromuramoyl-L-alanine amidase
MKTEPALFDAGWYRFAAQRHSPNFNSRPFKSNKPCEISLLVIHSISLPPGEYGGDFIDALFTNRLDTRAHPYFEAFAVRVL